MKEVQIFIDKKEMPYSHPNMVVAINSWLPYLTNTDLDELIKRICAMKDHREEKQKQVHTHIPTYRPHDRDNIYEEYRIAYDI